MKNTAKHPTRVLRACEVCEIGASSRSPNGKPRSRNGSWTWPSPVQLRALDIADYLIRQEFPDGRYATAQISIFDPESRTLEGAAAGHPGPLIWDAGRNSVIDPFGERGLPLGMRDLRPGNQETCCMTLEPGSFAAYFTDGLLEWNRDYVRGEAALRDALSQEDVRNSARPAKALRLAVVQGKHEDDLAVLTLRVEQ